MTRRFVSAVFIVFGLAATAAHADIIISRGVGTAPFSGKSFFGKLEMKHADEKAAIRDAEINAIDTYFAKLSGASTANYENVKAKIDANLSRYVLSYVILDKQKSDSDITVSLKAKLNGSMLKNTVMGASATSKTKSSVRSPILSIFVARQIESTKTFDKHVYKRVDTGSEVNADIQGQSRSQTTVSHQGSQGQSIGTNRISVNDNKTTDTSARAQANVTGHTHTSQTKQSGGSTVVKSSQTTWRIFPSSDLNSAITSELTGQGYQVVDEAFVEGQTNGLLSIKQINHDYSRGQDLQPSTLVNMEKGAKKLGIRYLALGTMDMGQTGTDPNNGNVRVGVTVNAKVYDLSGRFPRQAVVVGPVQFFGESSTEQAAQVQALKNAGTDAAKEMSSRMQEEGLQ